jgi:hypothetical protein
LLKRCSRQIRNTLSQLQDQSASISTSVAGQAHQTQCIATSVFSAEHTINEVNARLEALAVQISSQTQIDTTTTTCTTLSFRFMPLSITLEQTSSRKQRTVTKPKPTVRLLTVRLPKWFLHRQYDLQLLYATSGWPFTLNACNIVQDDSPFFMACKSGDVDTIKVLLSNKQASIYDRHPNGTTAFHFAISGGQLEVCKLLRHAGIFAQFDDDDYRHSLSGLGWFMDDFTEHNLSLLRVAAPLNNPDPGRFIEDFPPPTEATSLRFYIDPELLFLLNSFPSETAMLNLSHLAAYFQWRNKSSHYIYQPFIPYIFRVLSSISIVREITAARDEYAWIVYGLARETAYAFHGEQLHQTRHSVPQELCAMVSAGLNPHQTSGRRESSWCSDEWYQNLPMTPLGLLCVEATRVCEEFSNWPQSGRTPIGHADAALQAWISGLHSAGVDLLQYAESESACYGHVPGLLVIPWRDDASITVVTGPRPEDWHLSLWEPCESHARLFWCLVDGTPVVPRLIARILEAYFVPECQDLTSPDLPGSWPSEQARIAENLEGCLLTETDDELARIEEDLPLLSESDSFAKWDGLDYILGPRAQQWFAT